MDPTKNSRSSRWPQPTTVTTSVVLGFRFYDTSSQNTPKSRNLFTLTRKRQRLGLSGGKEQKGAFEHLTLGVDAPVLAQPTLHKPFVEHTDRSAYGLGHTLQEEERKYPQTSKPQNRCPPNSYSATFIKREKKEEIYDITRRTSSPS